MAVTNFSPLLGLALPTTGDLAGTWGTTVNDSITSLLDSAVAGTTTLSVDADVTLSTTNGAANQARNAVILWTANNGATTRNITAPAQSKAYIVINAGNGSIVVRGAGPTTGATITSGEKALVAWNGSDFVIVSSSIINLTSEVTGVLPTANGGTGLTGFTAANYALYSTSASALTAGTLPVIAGGTGQTTFTNGQLLIGNSTGNTLTKSTLTAGSGVTITNGSGSIEISLSGDGMIYPGAGVAVSTGTAWATSLAAPSSALVGISDTQTLSNKRTNPRVVSAATATSLTPSIATADIYAYTALASGLTINAPTGTPVDGDKLIFRILDNGTTRTITWNATFTSMVGPAFTNTFITTANKTSYIGCIYNANNTRWDVIASVTQG